MTEKKIAAGTGDVTWHDYVEADGKRVAMRVFDEQTLNTTWNYFVHDHLGSIVATMDSLGNVVERMSFDAWGKRREPATAAFYAAGFTPSLTTPRGFTGHEHIDEVGLVNMNARVYDPELGRFLQADSIIEDPQASKTLNRYSYVANNPLSYTDPSGHLFGLDDLFIAIVAAVLVTAAAVITDIPILKSLAAVTWGIALWQFGYVGAFAGGFIGGGITGGDLKSAVIGGLTALAAAGIHGLKGIGATWDKTLGKWVENPGIGVWGKTVGRFARNRLGSAVLHGARGGLSAVASGGKFKKGFLVAGVSDFVGSYLPKSEPENMGELVRNTATHAAIGGAVSVAGGGKFGNGAVVAAYGYLYNGTLRSLRAEDTKEKPDVGDEIVVEGKPLMVNPLKIDLVEGFFGDNPQKLAAGLVGLVGAVALIGFVPGWVAALVIVLALYVVLTATWDMWYDAGYARGEEIWREQNTGRGRKQKNSGRGSRSKSNEMFYFNAPNSLSTIGG